MSPSPCSFTTALDESFTLTVSLPVIFCSTSTSLLFSRVGNLFLTVVDMDKKKLCSCNAIFIESQMVWQDKTSSPIEFPTQLTKTSNDDQEAHAPNKEESPVHQTR